MDTHKGILVRFLTVAEGDEQNTVVSGKVGKVGRQIFVCRCRLVVRSFLQVVHSGKKSVSQARNLSGPTVISMFFSDSMSMRDRERIVREKFRCPLRKKEEERRRERRGKTRGGR